MKILILTSKRAYTEAKSLVKRTKISPSSSVQVVALDIDVASLLTPTILERGLTELNDKLKENDLVLVTGKITWDLAELEKQFGIKVRKGTQNLLDLPILLENLEKVPLSTSESAEQVMKAYLKNRDDNLLKEALAGKKVSFKIGDVEIGEGLPFAVVAEINDVPNLKKEELIEKVRYYEKWGADIIDLGMVPNKVCTNLDEIISACKSVGEIPLSIDSMNPEEINKACDLGCDLVLSATFDNYEELNVDKKKAIVAIPYGNGTVLRNRPKMVEELIQRLDERGYKNVLADLILEPFPNGMVSSISSFYEFRQLHPETPILMGFGNVTELMDADSTGINALLAAQATELEASLVLTTEASPKTFGCVKEVKRASRLAFLAKSHNTFAKDFGVNLLRFKAKTLNRTSEKELSNLQIVEASPRDFERDAVGDFRIYVLRDKIAAVQGKTAIFGTKAEEIYKEIISRNLVTRLDHAAYLGRELEKAELALNLGRGYEQDEDLF